MNYFQMARQDFIGVHIAEFGEINRKDIMDKFSIGAAQSTRDLKTFISNNPDALIYNLTSKQYEVNNGI